MIGPTSGWLGGGGAAELTSLAVKAGNLRSGLSSTLLAVTDVGRTQRGPAVEIDPRTAALAEAIQALPAAAPVQDAASASTIAARKAEAAAGRRDMVEGYEAAVLQQRQQLVTIRESIRLFEETGKVHTTDQNGDLKPADERITFEAHGGPAGYVEAMRRSLIGIEAIRLPEWEAAARRLRADYEKEYGQ